MSKIGVIVMVLLIANAVAADVMIIKIYRQPKEKTVVTIPENKIECPEVSLTPSEMPSETPTKTPPRKKIKTTSYIPIPGKGESSAMSWEGVAGTEFYFNTEDYPGLKEARLEVNMKLLNGNGTAFARLFDVTSGIEVWGSEVQTTGQSFSVVISDKLVLRPGNRLYRIQAKSLTADTTVFNSGRIRLMTEN